MLNSLWQYNCRSQKGNSKFYQEDLRRRSINHFHRSTCCMPTPLSTKIQAYDRQGLGKFITKSQEKLMFQHLRKKLLHQLGHYKYGQGQRLDLKQLYMIWRKILNKNQQRQFYQLMLQILSTQSAERYFFVMFLFYALLHPHLKQTVMQHKLGYL